MNNYILRSKDKGHGETKYGKKNRLLRNAPFWRRHIALQFAVKDDLFFVLPLEFYKYEYFFLMQIVCWIYSWLPNKISHFAKAVVKIPVNGTCSTDRDTSNGTHCISA